MLHYTPWCKKIKEKKNGRKLQIQFCFIYTEPNFRFYRTRLVEKFRCVFHILPRFLANLNYLQYIIMIRQKITVKYERNITAFEIKQIQ